MEDDMTSQNKPEVRLSEHNHVLETAIDDESIFQSITLDPHFREQLRSSKVDEVSMKSVENNNSVLPTEGTGRSAPFAPAQKAASRKMSGHGDDGVVEPNRSMTLNETSEQKDCEHTYFGVAETRTDGAPFMAGREGADDPREGPRPGNGTLPSSICSGSTVAASHSLDLILDGRETGGKTKTESTSPKPSLITTDKKQQLSFTTNPLSLPKGNNQTVGPTSSPPQTSSSMTGVLDSPTSTQSTSAVASFFTSDTGNGGSSPLLLRPIETHFVVVAIDFGTTMSGYAFSFVRDPSSIHMMRKWEGGDPGVINQKTPTTLLLSPDGDFHSFGFTARDFYHDLDNKEAKRWLYFEKFKMALHYNAVSSKSIRITGRVESVFCRSDSWWAIQ